MIIWIVLLLILPVLLCRTRIQPAVTLLVLIAWWAFSLKTLGPRPHGAALAVGGTLILVIVAGIKVRAVRALTASPRSIALKNESTPPRGKGAP